MWSRLSSPWQAALAEAWAGYCAGTIPIGAAVADPSGQVIATGRNRLYEARGGGRQQAVAGPHLDGGDGNYIAGVKLAHAEINALMAMPPGSPRAYTLYTTTEPCPMCAGALLMCGLRSVAFAARDPWAGSTNMYETTSYMRSKQMHVEGPLPRLETLLFGLQVDFFLRETVVRQAGGRAFGERANALYEVIDAMAAVDPTGVELGKRLFASGELHPFVESNTPVEPVIDWLEALAIRV